MGLFMEYGSDMLDWFKCLNVGGIMVNLLYLNYLLLHYYL